MKESLRKLLVFGTWFIIAKVTYQTGTHYNHEYILIVDMNMNWIEAQNYCRAEYSDLATISNWLDINRINDIANDWEHPFWIGLYDDVNSWKWSLVGEYYYTGVTEHYRNWQEAQPDNALSEEHCVSIMEDGFWRDNSCSLVKMALICFRDSPHDQYVLVTEEKNWFEAQVYCRQYHTDLVSVRGPAENQEVRSRLQDNQMVQEAWIGLYRDSWKWSDSSLYLFGTWWGDQPNNADNNEACVTMFKGRWNDWNCDTSFSVLCQRKTKVTQTSPAEPTAIRQAVQKRTAVKMRLQTDSDLTDPTLRHEVIQQFEAAVRLQGFADVKLVWRTLKKEPQPTESGASGEEIT